MIALVLIVLKQEQNALRAGSTNVNTSTSYSATAYYIINKKGKTKIVFKIKQFSFIQHAIFRNVMVKSDH